MHTDTFPYAFVTAALFRIIVLPKLPQDGILKIHIGSKDDL